MYLHNEKNKTLFRKGNKFFILKNDSEKICELEAQTSSNPNNEAEMEALTTENARLREQLQRGYALFDEMKGSKAEEVALAQQKIKEKEEEVKRIQCCQFVL